MKVVCFILGSGRAVCAWNKDDKTTGILRSTDLFLLCPQRCEWEGVRRLVNGEENKDGICEATQLDDTGFSSKAGFEINTAWEGKWPCKSKWSNNNYNTKVAAKGNTMLQL